MSKAWHCHMPGLGPARHHIQLCCPNPEPVVNTNDNNVKWPIGARVTSRLSMPATDANRRINHILTPVYASILLSSLTLLTTVSKTLVWPTARAPLQYLKTLHSRLATHQTTMKSLVCDKTSAQPKPLAPRWPLNSKPSKLQQQPSQLPTPP